MKLLIAAGIVKPSDIEEQVGASEAALAVLAETANSWVAMGYRPTADDLAAYLPCEKAALLHAVAKFEGQRAVRSAVAAQGPLGLAVASGDPEVGTDIALGIGLAKAVEAAKRMEPEKR